VEKNLNHANGSAKNKLRREMKQNVRNPMSKTKIWFITGASRGFGRIWTEAVLKRGDQVAATARDLKSLSSLVSQYGEAALPLQLDVTDHGAVVAAVNRAHSHFGRLDVVLSNAGYALMGALEEAEIDEARANFETNVGTLSVVQAALPLMRKQNSGHILAVSSVGGLVTFPLGGVYQATKFAVEGMLQTLAQEVAGFNINVTLVEPGPFATNFMSETSLKQTKSIAAYDQVREQLSKMLTPDMFGDPDATADALLKVVDADKPPVQVIFGPLLPLVKQVYGARMQSWEQWDDVSRAAFGR
jgi:NAD(P)-dependent dehydrogenase (short-subunit alcohol dehydrogenase family)